MAMFLSMIGVALHQLGHSQPVGVGEDLIGVLLGVSVPDQCGEQPFGGDHRLGGARRYGGVRRFGGAVPVGGGIILGTIPGIIPGTLFTVRQCGDHR